MPQTLLSLLALSIAAVYSLGQQTTSTQSMESIIRDEFELAVMGTLLHAMEFADSRAFDEATTPTNLRLRLGLPIDPDPVVFDTLSMSDFRGISAESFTPPSSFGRTPSGAPAGCNIRTPLASPNCNDISDLHSNVWQQVTFQTPNGDPVPVEVRIQVSYVEGGDPDQVVTRQTFHKLVEIEARSPFLSRKYPEMRTRLRRVISYDPATALEYLTRSLRRGDEETHVNIAELQAALAAAEAQLASAQAALSSAQSAAQQAQTQAVAAQSAQTQAQANVVSAASTVASAQASLTSAQASASSAQATRNQAATRLQQAQTAYDNATGLISRWLAWRELESAQSAFNSAAAASNTANANVSSAQNALAQAQSAHQQAQQALTAAQTAAASAALGASTAQQSVAAAQAAVTQAEQAVAAAQAALNAALGAGRR